MSRIIRESLIALSCGVLCGCASVSVEKSGPAAGSDLSWTQNLNATYSEAKDSPRYQEWKSCIDLLYPEGFRSVSDLQRLFQEPHDSRQLLRNLKLARDRDLLLEPYFYDPAVLRKFFAGTKVTWRQSQTPLLPDVGFVVGQLNSQVVEGMDVRVENRCWQRASKSSSGQARATVIVIGFITITGGPFHEMTLKRIRDVLGPETQTYFHSEGVEGQLARGSDTKGSVLYAGWDKVKHEGAGVEITFDFTSEQDPQPYAPITEDDVPQRINMSEERHRTLEK